MQDLQALLRALIHSPIDFVLVGGFAAVLHGCNQSTRDIDICIVYSPESIQQLRDTLGQFNPRHLMGPEMKSFLEEPKDLSVVHDLHLVTDIGILDVISHIKGVGDYYDVLSHSDEIEIEGGKCYIISIDDLIKSKKALGRHRDLITIMELEAIREEKNKSS